MKGEKIKKLSGKQLFLLKARSVFMTEKQRTRFLEESGLFASFGKNCRWNTREIPDEPYMVKVHNNVDIARNVSFITHDVVNDLLARKFGVKTGEQLSEFYMGTIEIFDNVMIGAGSIIMYNTKIVPNAVVAAGSVVTKDVPEGAIVGGNPAKVIGKIDDLLEKRKKLRDMPLDRDDLETIMDYFWNDPGGENENGRN